MISGAVTDPSRETPAAQPAAVPRRWVGYSSDAQARATGQAASAPAASTAPPATTAVVDELSATTSAPAPASSSEPIINGRRPERSIAKTETRLAGTIA